MKKMICAILALLLMLTGCQTAGGETTPPTGSVPATTETDPSQTATFPTLPEGGFSAGPAIGTPEGEEIPFENAGKLRISYEGNRSYVRYVTSVEDLPAEGNWEGYDEAYFQTKALLIVVETLSSGSIQVELEAIVRRGDTANVVIRRTMSGEVGTADMATWMLWAEVSRELDYTWTLDNATQYPVGEKY